MFMILGLSILIIFEQSKNYIITEKAKNRPTSLTVLGYRVNSVSLCFGCYRLGICNNNNSSLYLYPTEQLQFGYTAIHIAVSKCYLVVICSKNDLVHIISLVAHLPGQVELYDLCSNLQIIFSLHS